MDFLIYRWANRLWSAKHQVRRETEISAYERKVHLGGGDRCDLTFPSLWLSHSNHAGLHNFPQISLFLPQALDTSSFLCLGCSYPSSSIIQFSAHRCLLEKPSLLWCTWFSSMSDFLSPFSLCYIFILILIAMQNFVFNHMLISYLSFRM